MALGPDAVDGHASVAPRFDTGDEACGLGVGGRVEVVVIDPQFCVRVGGAGGAEGERDVVFSYDGEEGGLPQCAVFVEGLVHDVPVCHFAFVVRHDGRDVVLHCAGQGRFVGDLGDPGGQLRVPDERVATDALVVLGRPVDEVVGRLEVEGVLRGLEGVPFHRVLGGYLAEFFDREGGPGVGGAETVLVGAGAPVQLACGFEGRVEGLVGLTGEEGGSGRGGGDEEGGCRRDEGGEEHCDQHKEINCMNREEKLDLQEDGLRGEGGKAREGLRRTGLFYRCWNYELVPATLPVCGHAPFVAQGRLID